MPLQVQVVHTQVDALQLLEHRVWPPIEVFSASITRAADPRQNEPQAPWGTALPVRPLRPSPSADTARPKPASVSAWHWAIASSSVPPSNGPLKQRIAVVLP